MSYILEALRKSERDRQATQTPTLPALLTDPPPRRRQWIYWLLALLLALNGAGLVWLWLSGWGKHPPPAHSAGSETPPPLAAPVATPAAKADAGPSNTLSLSGVPPAAIHPGGNSPPVAKSTAPKPPAKPAAASRPAKPASEEKSEFPYPPLAARQANQERLDEPQEYEDEEDDEEPPPVALLEKAPRPAAVLREPARIKPIPDADEDADAARREPEPGDSDAIPWIGALPGDFRRRLPEFNINIFAYSNAPAERFAIIDMRKYRVGDRIPGDALLLEIRSDSLVLEMEGQKFRYPRP